MNRNMKFCMDTYKKKAHIIIQQRKRDKVIRMDFGIENYAVRNLSKVSRNKEKSS